MAPDIVEMALECALRRGLTTPGRLTRRLEAIGGNGRRGSGVLRGILEGRGNAPPTDSALEIKVVQLLRAAGLPPPVRQYKFRREGRILAHIDLTYPDERIAIECEGFEFHSARDDWHRDLRRRNMLAAAGWMVLHIAWDDLRDPERVAEEIRVALEARRLSLSS